MDHRDVLIVGAGVIGLTTAVRLAEDGWNVHIRTADDTHATTSMAAGALCGLAFGEPADKVPGWDAATQRELARVVEDPAAGVRVRSGLLASRTPIDLPPPMRSLPGFADAQPADLPAGFAGGFWIRLPVVDMPRYLDHLLERLRRAGGTIERVHVASLADAARDAPVIVNCAGVGAQRLAGDQRVQPVRGQHVVVTNPGIEHFFMEGPPGVAEWASFVPHGEHVVLGGSAQPGVWDTEPDAAIAESILQRCIGVEPRFAETEVVEHRVGLRPQRDVVRVEEERIDGGAVHPQLRARWARCHAVVGLRTRSGQPARPPAINNCVTCGRRSQARSTTWDCARSACSWAGSGAAVQWTGKGLGWMGYRTAAAQAAGATAMSVSDDGCGAPVVVEPPPRSARLTTSR
jgi:D-amino-acid oxidase